MAPLIWLVTGCSSGFGVSFVESILAKGDKVIATARGDVNTRLSSLKKLGAAILELDVTSPQTELDRKAAEAVEIHGRIDVLVNNAGYVDAGMIEEVDNQIMIDSLTTNALGAINLTRAVLPYMRKQKSGTIIINGSMTTYYGAPGSGPYCASKGLLEALTNVLQVEVSPFNIQCCIIAPGMYRTNVFRPDVIQYRAPNQISDYHEMNQGVKDFVSGLDRTQSGDPRKATDIVVDAVHGDGLAKGKKLPLRMPLGKDSLDAVREYCKETLRVCDEWEDVVGNTDFDV